MQNPFLIPFWEKWDSGGKTTLIRAEGQTKFRLRGECSVSSKSYNSPAVFALQNLNNAVDRKFKDHFTNSFNFAPFIFGKWQQVGKQLSVLFLSRY